MACSIQATSLPKTPPPSSVSTTLRDPSRPPCLPPARAWVSMRLLRASRPRPMHRGLADHRGIEGLADERQTEGLADRGPRG